MIARSMKGPERRGKGGGEEKKKTFFSQNYVVAVV